MQRPMDPSCIVWLQDAGYQQVEPFGANFSEWTPERAWLLDAFGKRVEAFSKEDLHAMHAVNAVHAGITGLGNRCWRSRTTLQHLMK